VKNCHRIWKGGGGGGGDGKKTNPLGIFKLFLVNQISTSFVARRFHTVLCKQKPRHYRQVDLTMKENNVANRNRQRSRVGGMYSVFDPHTSKAI
jgi:hypothetical protein